MSYQAAPQETGGVYGFFARRDLIAIYSILASLIISIYFGFNVSICQYLFVLVSGLAPTFLLVKKKLADFIVFCVVLFLVTPFVRRLADSYLGYSPISLIMMTPYLASSLSIVALVHTSLGGRFNFPLPIVLVLVSVFYGYLLAFLGGRVVAGTFDLLRWAIPPCVALLIAFNPSNKPEILSKLTGTFLLFVPIISLYGYYQYAYLPKWDALWMFNAEMDSIGLPVPYEVRVFSILNSPGTCGNILMFGILLSLGSKGPIQWIIPVIGMIGLSLTLFRSAWVSLAFGILYVILFGPLRARLIISAAIGVIVLAAPPFLAMTGMEEAITQRVSSLFYLRSDNSASERSASYEAFLQHFADDPMGIGLAVAGTYRANSGEGKLIVIDGGPIEIFSALGIVFGTLYIGSFFYLCGSLVVSRRLRNHSEFIGCKAVLVGYALLMTSATATVGESGFMMWLAVGLLMPVTLKYSSRQLKSPPCQ